MTTYSILFVCTDNLSRSPTAEVVLHQKAKQLGLSQQLNVASAATHDLNTGEPIDYHVQKHAMRRGYDMSALCARLLESEDFGRFDLILAMEDSTLQTLHARCPTEFQYKLQAFTNFCSAKVGPDVPDLFYGKPGEIELVLDLIEDGCDGVLAYLATTRTISRHLLE
jgi:protein-tyrosine phosphatase